MRTWLLVTGTALISIVFVAALLVGDLSERAASQLSNDLQLVAAIIATVGSAVAARRCTGPRRHAWWWLAAGTGSWAAGQLVWTFYDDIVQEQLPFPSAADVGYLAFPLAAAVGLVIWLGSQSHELAARGRDVLDGAIIAGSLLLLSWVTALGTVFSAGGSTWEVLVLSLAYPVGDLIIATLVLMALARGKGAERTTLALLALGLGGVALADSAYAYLLGIENYSAADLVSSGWVAGFLLVGVAGLTVERDQAPVVRLPSVDDKDVVVRVSKLRLTLPYVPLVAAGAALGVQLLNAGSPPTVDLLLGFGLVLLVLTRQFLAMADNQRLLGALAVARDQLKHQALHDALTGLPNRVLFADRLDRALLRPDADVSVLFCDLDDFKLVNDELGHEAGDILLALVAERLLACVRITDTVARLGGDEFAILLEDADDTQQVADRVVLRLQEPAQVSGHQVCTSISVGMARHQGNGAHAHPEHRRDVSAGRRTPLPTADGIAAAARRDATAAQLLRAADTAMYAAKGAGKSQAVLSDVTAT